MSTTSTPPDASPPDRDADPFRLGWRYVKRPQPDGTDRYDQIPLTEQDLLYPEEDDFVVTDDIHGEIMYSLAAALSAKFASTPGVVVRWDGRVGWAAGDVLPLGPDVIVFFDVPRWRRGLGTFDLEVEGGRPVAVIEITSPSTRHNDVGIKVELYERAGVEWYVIVDRAADGGAVRLVCYHFIEGRRVPVEPDASGRLWLAPLAVWLALRDGRVVVIDAATGEPIPDLTGALRARDEANRRADDERRRAEEATRRADDERRRAEDECRRAEEATRRADDERRRAEEATRRADDVAARYRDLEAELRRLRGETP